MLTTAIAAGLSLLPLIQAQETVVGAYMFHRHGDRTAKSYPPANLTALGYQQVFTSGDYFRSRYIDSSASYKISGMSSNIVKYSQIAVSAPSDTVLQNSAQGFLQGLYPAVGSSLDTQTLADGTNVTAPLNGYQLIPVATVSTGTASENSAWLQSTSQCYNAIVSSNQYFYSPEYNALLNSTHSFYQSILPVINNTFNTTTDTYKNAYTIFDLINVATIHNSTIQSPSLLTADNLLQIRTLADTHEYNLAYNASTPIRSIAGMTLAAQIRSFFNTTISTNGTNKLGIQFGAYASFQALFGLANLTAADPIFYGIPDYASVMIFELFTNATFTKFPAVEDLQVRFLWHNGTSSSTSEPAVYPLFGQTETSLSWTDFSAYMKNISVDTLSDWCSACGNTTGTCSPQALGTASSNSTSSSSSSSSGGSHMSLAVAGVIGAFVTLAVILLVQALVLVLGGFTLISKKKLASGGSSNGSPEPKA